MFVIKRKGIKLTFLKASGESETSALVHSIILTNKGHKPHQCLDFICCDPQTFEDITLT